MLSGVSILALGFILGMRHATDPDHVLAVTTIVSQQRSVGRAARVGALWGAGHTATIVLVGGAILLFRFAVPPRLGLAMELLVAVMLILLGVGNVRAAGDGRGPGDGAEAQPEWDAIRPAVVGFVHGLAGSAFVAMLLLAAIESAAAGVAYLLVYGAGTVAGMTLVTAAIAVPSSYAAARVVGARRFVQLAAGVASVGFGLFLAHRVGVSDGLFSAAPYWTPR